MPDYRLLNFMPCPIIDNQNNTRHMRQSIPVSNIDFVFCFLSSVVEFATKEDMKTALKKLDGTDINSKKIRLKVVSPIVVSLRRNYCIDIIVLCLVNFYSFYILIRRRSDPVVPAADPGPDQDPAHQEEQPEGKAMVH